MPDTILWALQQALYGKLTSSAGLTGVLPNGADDIYDHVPADTNTPYCLYRLGGAEKIATKGGDALDITIAVEIYDASKSAQTIRIIADQMHTALDGAAFSLTDHNIIDCRFERETAEVLQGGQMRKISQIYKIIIEHKEI